MMDKFNKLVATLDARKPEERVLLLAVVLLVLGLVWLTFVHDVATANLADLQRRTTVLDGQIAAEAVTQADITATYTTDPNAFAVNRIQELRAALLSTDERLDELYGELISPQQMSLVLTSLLQSETSLDLVSLENTAPEMLVTSTALVDAAGAVAGSGGVDIFKHGLRMVFEGEYLETVRFLRNLERLENSFFWENLDFEVTAYPRATITVDIYTLSSERGWIGV